VRFTDRVLVVTASRSGIGEATVRKLAEDGGNVVIVDLDDAVAIARPQRSQTVNAAGAALTVLVSPLVAGGLGGQH
jgi:NAD(P)-dependent dehydrogenase (short-subunit alcohol dehydrogenase family)